MARAHEDQHPPAVFPDVRLLGVPGGTGRGRGRGVTSGPTPGVDFEVLPLALVVVIIGGLGSLGGAVLGSLFVGIIDSLGKALFPELSYFTLFAPMILILALRPTGLLGRE